MASVNKVILIGNLTRPPELRYTPKGTACCEIGLAVNRKWKTDTGETKEEVTFLDVTFWGKTAETVTKFCKKGDPIYLEARLQMDSWEDKTSGQKRSKIRLIAEEFQFLNRGPAGTGSTTQSTQSAPPAPEANPAQDVDDDIPF